MNRILLYHCTLTKPPSRNPHTPPRRRVLEPNHEGQTQASVRPATAAHGQKRNPNLPPNGNICVQSNPATFEAVSTPRTKYLKFMFAEVPEVHSTPPRHHGTPHALTEIRIRQSRPRAAPPLPSSF